MLIYTCDEVVATLVLTMLYVCSSCKQHGTSQQEGQSTEPLSEHSVLHETPEAAQPVDEELPKGFMEGSNSQKQNQLCFVISRSMYQDLQQIKDSLKIMWNKSYERLHFFFRVEYLDANISRVGSIVSDKCHISLQVVQRCNDFIKEILRGKSM